MISKESIESAIILAKQLYKKSKSKTISLTDTTLLQEVCLESFLVSNNIDFDLDDIINGSSYDKLVDDIYESLTNSVTLDEEGNAVTIETPHDVAMDAYVKAMGVSFGNNLRFLKDVVLYNVKDLLKIIEEAKNEEVSTDYSYFRIEKAVLPEFFVSELWNAVVNEYSWDDADFIIDNSIDLGAAMTDSEDKTYLSNLVNYNPNLREEDLTILHDYFDLIKHPRFVKTDINAYELKDFSILISLFIGLKDRPYFNSGKSADENSIWANNQLKLLVPAARDMVKAHVSSLNKSELISPNTKNIDKVVLRRDTDSKDSPIILVHTDNISEEFKPFINSIIGGFLVDKRHKLSDISRNNLTQDLVDRLTRNYEKFVQVQETYISDCIEQATNERVTNVVLDFVNERRNILSEQLKPLTKETCQRYVDQASRDYGDDTYKLAAYIVSSLLFDNTNAYLTIDLGEQLNATETDEDFQLELVKTVTSLILRFLKNQFHYNGD